MLAACLRPGSGIRWSSGMERVPEGPGVAPSGPWVVLSLYESAELVRRFAHERMGRRPTETKAREISAHFSQGREYFRSAAGASELVRPLILYYGAMSLARGAILFLDRGKSKITAEHGLKTNGWNDVLTRPECLPELSVRTQAQGTFPELARVTRNSECCWVRSVRDPGVTPAWSVGPEIEVGTTFTVKDILSQIPDVADPYERTFAEHGRRLRCEVRLTRHLAREPSVPFLEADVPPDREVRRQARLDVLATRHTGGAGLPPAEWIVETVGDGRLHHDPSDLPLSFARDPRNVGVRTHTFDLYYDAGSQEKPRWSSDGISL